MLEWGVRAMTLQPPTTESSPETDVSGVADSVVGQAVRTRRDVLDDMYRNGRKSRPKKPINMVQPWHRQRGESTQAYAGFMTYLTLPAEDRSLGKAAIQCGKSEGLFRRWSSQWSWGLRVAAYEEHYLLLRLDSLAADKDAMWRQQQDIGRTGVNIVEGMLAKMIMDFQGEDGTFKLEAMKPEAMIRFLAEATKLQRTATLGRIESAEQTAKDNEALTERHADELVRLINDVVNAMSLSEEQMKQAQKVIIELLEQGSVT